MRVARDVATAAAMIVGTLIYAAYAYYRRQHRMRDNVRAGIIASGVDRDELIRHELLLPRENVETEP